VTKLISGKWIEREWWTARSGSYLRNKCKEKNEKSELEKQHKRAMVRVVEGKWIVRTRRRKWSCGFVLSRVCAWKPFCLRTGSDGAAWPGGFLNVVVILEIWCLVVLPDDLLCCTLAWYRIIVPLFLKLFCAELKTKNNAVVVYLPHWVRIIWDVFLNTSA